MFTDGLLFYICSVPSEYVISEEDLKDVPPVPKRDGTNSRLSSPAPAATRWTRAESMARIENEPVDDDLVFQRKVAKRQRQRLYFVKLL